MNLLSYYCRAFCKAAFLKMETHKEKKKRKPQTPEQIAARRKKNQEYMRKVRQMRREVDTPEQAAARRALAAEKERERLRKHRAARPPKRQRKTPEELAAYRRLKNTESNRIYRQKRLENETPEETEARRVKFNMYRQTLRAMETPEKTAERLLKKRENSRRLRQMIREAETPEEKESRRAHKKEMDKRRRHRRQNIPENALSGQMCLQKQEHIDSDDIHGSCTWSSFGPSESHSTADALSTTEGHSTTEGSYSRTIISTENTEPDPQNTYNADAVKPEPPRDSWSFYEVTEIGIKDQIQQNEDIKYQEIDNKHLVFAASIAERLKTCNRDKSEIEAAKRAIDSILENLAMGAHSSVSFSESKVPEDVFIKQEVDQ